MFYGNVVLFLACLVKWADADQLEPRREQCAAYNGRLIMGHVINDWTPSINMRHSCQLSCYSETHRLVYSFGKVRDGAKCHQSASKVCLNGRCLLVGCDRKIGSAAVRDMCGVCGGKNDTCKRIKRIHSIDHKKKKVNTMVVTIPAKSTNIAIYGDGINHLALLDSQNDVIINGSVTGSGTYKAPRAHTLFRYYKDLREGVERFHAVGPTADLVNVVIQRSNSTKSKPKVIFEFWAPHDVKTNELVVLPTVTSMTSLPVKWKKPPADDATKKKFKKSRTKEKKKKKKRKRSKSGRRKCPPCTRSTNMKQHFCASDFVLHVLVLHTERRGSEIRYELQVDKSFRNLVPIHQREYLWEPEACSCPKLVRGRHYIIMGNTAEDHDKREVRLVIDDKSYVRRYDHQRARKMQKLSMLCD